MSRGALWIFVFLCLSMSVSAQQGTQRGGLDMALNEIASELVEKLNRQLPQGATLSVADIGFRLDGDREIVECAPLSSNLENRLADRLIDLTDDGKGVSFIKPPPGLSPDRTLVGFWEKIDNERAGITFELRNTRDPRLTITLDVESRTLRLTDLNNNQRKCIFDLFRGPGTTEVAGNTPARVVDGPNPFGKLLKLAEPEKPLTVIRVAEVGDDQWAIVPVDSRDQNFGFVDCTFLATCDEGIGPWPWLLGAAAIGGGVALASGGGGGDDGPTPTCPENPAPDELVVDFGNEGEGGNLPVRISRTDPGTDGTGFVPFVELRTEDAFILNNESITSTPKERQIPIRTQWTTVFFRYLSAPGHINSFIMVQIIYGDGSGGISVAGSTVDEFESNLGGTGETREKRICLQFNTIQR